MQSSLLLALLISATVLNAQTAADPNAAAAEILRRLDHLERQNDELREEVRALRAELKAHTPEPAISAATPSETPPLEDRVAVVESRVDEQAQTKVESSQKLPIALTGMVLFNAFANSRSTTGSYGGLLALPDRDGATISQSLLGLRFTGAPLPGGGRVSGLLEMDFYGGATYAANSSASNGYSLRIRRGLVNFDWERRSVMVGQDKPLISQRQPDSLAEVVLPPLAGAGNPWYWQPQVRYTEHVKWGADTGVDLQAAVLATYEDAAQQSDWPKYQHLDPTRPALEGRVGLWHRWGEDRRVEIGPGFQVSTTHVDGYSVPSRFVSVDWLVKPVSWMEWTGLVFGGQNIANLGGFSNGFILSPDEDPIAVRGIGGWSQVSFTLRPRWTLNVFGGLQAPRTHLLGDGSVSHGNAYAANLMYRLRSNILVAAEALQQRTGVVGEAHAIQNHYDLAIGYLF